jgi:integrase
VVGCSDGYFNSPVNGKGIRNFSKRTFHFLRHSFNSALANAGVAEKVRRKLTGHALPMMNEKYTHLNADTLKGSMASLPLFGSNPGGSETGPKSRQ